MTPLLRAAKTKMTAVAASVALGIGCMVTGALPATAAPGDVTAYLVGDGATPVDIITAPDGTMWAANEGANSISRVTTDGQITSFPVPGVGPNSLVFGPDGAVWFTYSGTSAIGRMDTSGTARNYSTGVPNGRGSDIEVGYDSKLWFTMPDAQLIGRISTAGEVVRYSGVGAAESIAVGPVRSGEMYFSSGVGGLGAIATLTGARRSIATPGATSTGPIHNAGGNVWFEMTDAQGRVKLGKATRAGIVEVDVPQIANVNEIATGPDKSVYITDTASQRIVHVTANGAVAAVVDSGADAHSSTLGEDGNLWVAAGTSSTPGQIRRILTGIVPTLVVNSRPFTTPSTGLSSGSQVLANKAIWKYEPASYAYQWQACANQTETTCVDIPGATGASYIVADSDVGKYLRVGVTATNLNGASSPSFSRPAATDGAAGSNAAGLSKVASIGGEYTMQLLAPKKQKRNQRKYYIVIFSAEDTEGTVTFQFRKGNRTKTKTVTISDDQASYRWKPKRRWRKGYTTVTATFQPSPGQSELTAAVVGSRVRIR
ncbi:MAG: virginiamycin B lyase family protein [Candidatus Nanopelagicales bacterium]